MSILSADGTANVDERWSDTDPGANWAKWSSQARLASQLWFSIDSVNRFILLRDWGAERTAEVEFGFMRKHQQTHFLDGVHKLGLQDEPDHILAAKYHVLSNLLGGLDMAYSEDEQGRAWVFQMPPNSWGASPLLPCPGLIQVPSSVLIAGMRGWEGNDGAMLGNDRLRWTVTELQTSDGPYDAGYFDIAPAPLAPDETMRVLLDSERPNPGPPPLLGPAIWPMERRNAALIKYSAQYALGSIAQIANFCTMEEAADIARVAFLHVFGQWSRPLLSEFGIHEQSSVRRCARLFQECFAVLGDEIELHTDGATITLEHKSSRLSVPEYAGWDSMPLIIEQGFAKAWQVISRQIGDEMSIEVAASRSQGAEATVWTFAAVNP
jgi:hypothetical protein